MFKSLKVVRAVSKGMKQMTEISGISVETVKNNMQMY